MGKIINGRAIADKILKKTAIRVAKLKKKKITSKLAVILVGNDKPSQSYVRMKELAAKKIGMDFALYIYPENITQKELTAEINKIQKDKKLSGLIVQLPLPNHLYTTEVLNTIKPEIDVDCLTDTNLGKLLMKTNYLTPPTPAAAIVILQELKINPAGKNITIIGMGALVGKPLAIIMVNERANVVTCNSQTKNIEEKCLTADIIITGVGKRNILKGNMVKPGAIVIDTGICFEKGKVYGDIDFEEVIKKASFVTPTPGGVGPITIANLLYNTLLCAERNN